MIVDSISKEKAKHLLLENLVAATKLRTIFTRYLDKYASDKNLYSAYKSQMENHLGVIYSNLVNLSILAYDFSNTRHYAEKAEQYGYGINAWFAYAYRFQELHYSGVKFQPGFSPFEEAVFGFKNVARLDATKGNFFLAELFDISGDIDKAICYYYYALEGNGCNNIKSKAKKRLSELLSK